MSDLLRKLGTAVWELWRDKTDEQNRARARMTPEEAARKAELAAEANGWLFEQVEPRLFADVHRGDRLMWSVHFMPKGGPSKGAQMTVDIDDETGEVLYKHLSPR